MRMFLFFVLALLFASPLVAQEMSVDSLFDIVIESGKSATIMDGKITITNHGGSNRTSLTFDGIVGVAEDYSKDINQYTEKSIRVVKNQPFFLAIDSTMIYGVGVAQQHRGDLTLSLKRLPQNGTPPSDFLGYDNSRARGGGWIGGLVSLSAISLSNRSVTGSFTGVTLAPTFCSFVTPNIGWGLDLSATRMSNETFTQTQLGLDLKWIVAFSSSQSRPYISLGTGVVIAPDSYLWPGSSESATRSGYRVKTSLGFLSRAGDNTGFPFELGFVYSTLESEQATMFTFGVGLVGILH